LKQPIGHGGRGTAKSDDEPGNTAAPAATSTPSRTNLRRLQSNRILPK
jgi:hypothetical protein